MDMLVGFSNCPHPLDPDPVYAPKPVIVTRFRAAAPAADDLCAHRHRRSRPRLREQRHDAGLRRGDMTDFIQTSASRTLENAVQDHFIPAEAPWSGIVRKGQTIRIEDSDGQQAVDTLFYRADDFSERYSSQDTMRAQGARLYRHRHEDHVQRGQRHADDDRPTAAAATTPRPAPAPARATPCASATTRSYLHACRDNFVLEVDQARHEQARHRAEHQLLHERADQAERRDDHRRRHFRARRLCRAGRRDGRALRHLQLPADQQSLQRLQSDADPRPDLGRRG